MTAAHIDMPVHLATARSTSARADTGTRPELVGLIGITGLLALVAQTGLVPLGYRGIEIVFAAVGIAVARVTLGRWCATRAIDTVGSLRRSAKRFLPIVLVMAITSILAGLLFGGGTDQVVAFRDAVRTESFVAWASIPGAGVSALSNLRVLALLALCAAGWMVLAGAASYITRRRPHLMRPVLALTVGCTATLAGVASIDGTAASAALMSFALGCGAVICKDLLSSRGARRRDRGRRSVRVVASPTWTGLGSIFGIAVVAWVAFGAVLPFDTILGGMLCSGFVIALTSNRNAMVRLFDLAPFVSVGRIAVALVLVQAPVLWSVVAIAPESTATDIATVGIPISLVVAGALHHLVVRPLREAVWSGRRVATIALTALALSFSFAALILLPL